MRFPVLVGTKSTANEHSPPLGDNTMPAQSLLGTPKSEAFTPTMLKPPNVCGS